MKRSVDHLPAPVMKARDRCRSSTDGTPEPAKELVRPVETPQHRVAATGQSWPTLICRKNMFHHAPPHTVNHHTSQIPHKPDSFISLPSSHSFRTWTPSIIVLIRTKSS